MADISKEIQDFRKAKKGKDVKGSMISLAEKVNREATDASQAAANSSASAGAAASNAQLAVNRADTAAQNANQAAQNIQDKADAGYFTGTVQIGTVTTGEPGSEASVSNSGTDKDAVLDITIPRGNQGISFRMRKAWEPEVDYVNDTSYIDIVSYDGGTYGCLTSHRSSELVTPANTAYWQCLAKKGETGSIDNIDDVKIDFAKAENRVNISPEDTLAIILGKVEKIYADLKAVAFSGKYSDLTGTLQNVSDLENDAGYVTENTWKANTASSEGYVAASQGQANMIWGTDAEGNPGWQDGVEIDEMAGATAEAAGAAGIVPAPAAGMQGAFLRGDATWGQLGAGAFAESANNLATTQEGFLLDARQGKELADQISLVNSAMESVNEKFLKIVMQENAFYNEADSKKFIDNFSESFSRNTFYRFVIGNYYSSADPLSGYIWYVDGFKMGTGYEWQMARTYRPDTNGTLYYRTKYSSSWKAWVKIL